MTVRTHTLYIFFSSYSIIYREGTDETFNQDFAYSILPLNFVSFCETVYFQFVLSPMAESFRDLNGQPGLEYIVLLLGEL